jgi:hypothetical protein
VEKGIFATTKSAKERLTSGKYKSRCKGKSCCQPVKPGINPAAVKKDGSPPANN